MTRPLAESLWLDDSHCCAIEELAEISGLSIAEIDDLIDNGVIAPAQAGVQPAAFQMSALLVVKTARRLRDDFELGRSGMTLALTLLQRIAALEAEIERHCAISAMKRSGRPTS